MSDDTSNPHKRTPPPLLVYLPGLSPGPTNSARRVADILADESSLGPGTFAAERLDSTFGVLGDGARIITEDGALVLDVLELDYRPRLSGAAASDNDTRGLLHQLLLALKYSFWAIQLLFGAGRHAKSGRAKVQIFLGFLSAAILVMLFLLTAATILVALGSPPTEPGDDGRRADALAVGLTALTTWLFVKARPTIVRLGLLIEKLMDFIHDDRQEASLARQVAIAVDQVLEADPDRRIHLLGYSLGSLVCLAFLFPKPSLHVAPDERHNTSIHGLFTIGCPVDFVRLYRPDYLMDRTERVEELAWTNIYIGADVLASNFLDGSDEADGTARSGLAAPADIPAPISLRYTSEELTWRNVVGRRGFLSHSGYWDEVGSDSCLRLIAERLPAFATMLESSD
jgi:pimeloyl-ACP methyl ester carboxylesterase